MTNSTFLNNKQISELKKIFDKNSDNIKSTLDIMKQKNSNRLKFFNDISFFRKEIELSYIEIEELINKGLLSVISERDLKLTLTLKALLMLEYGIIDPSSGTNKMLDDLNKRYFDNIMKTSKNSSQMRR